MIEMIQKDKPCSMFSLSIAITFTNKAIQKKIVIVKKDVD